MRRPDNSSSSSSNSSSPVMEPIGNSKAKKQKTDRDWTFHHYDFETKKNSFLLQSVTIEKSSNSLQEDNKQKILKKWNVHETQFFSKDNNSSASSSRVALLDESTAQERSNEIPSTSTLSAALSSLQQIDGNSSEPQIFPQISKMEIASSSQTKFNETHLLLLVNELMTKNQELEHRVTSLNEQIREKDQLIGVLLQTIAAARNQIE